MLKYVCEPKTYIRNFYGIHKFKLIEVDICCRYMLPLCKVLPITAFLILWFYFLKQKSLFSFKFTFQNNVILGRITGERLNLEITPIMQSQLPPEMIVLMESQGQTPTYSNVCNALDSYAKSMYYVWVYRVSYEKYPCIYMYMIFF